MSAPLRRLLWLPLVVWAGAAAAQEPAPPAAGPDTSSWTCRFCTFESGTSGWLEPRLGYLSDGSFRYGDYTGLEDQGLLLDLGGAWRYRNAETADAWDLAVERAGLDSRAFALRGGRQGTYRISLGYDQLPHLVDAGTRTIFTGDGPLGLPPGWTRGNSTQDMPQLDASLRPVWLRQDRERLAAGFEWIPHRVADLRFDYRRDEIRGTGAQGGSFITLASMLPRRIDQTLDRADVALGLRGALGHAQIALASSFFANEVDSLTWQNPYSGPVAGATQGQLAQAPDNRAHRLSLSLGSPAGGRLQTSAHLALGEMTQDERFLPATLNPDEAVGLPRNSLDGRVDTRFASLRAVYAVTGTTRVLGDYLHDQRDNRTPVAAYTQVVMDSFTGDVRSNAPFGWQRDRWRLSVEDRTVRSLRLGLGVENETRERRYHDTTETDELRYWGRVGFRPVTGGDLRLRLSHAERDGAQPATAPGAAPQNPLLRSYHTAARHRDEARADLGIGFARVTTTFNAHYAKDDYPETLVGRTGGSDFGYGVDVGAQASETLAVSGFAARRLQDHEQAGSQGFGLPDWAADGEDATEVWGVHAAWQAPRGFDFGADYAYARSEGTIAMATGAGDTGFPLLVSRWQDLRLFGRYALRPDLALRLDLLRDSYRAHDWALDGVGPDTVPNLLALGQSSQSGAVTAAVLSLRYEFRSAPPGDAGDD
jgi:MtrB/PioB family decaheme-associated outer membrane protein